MPDFLTPDQTRDRIRDAAELFFEQAPAWDAEGPDPAPVLAIAASPGAGKSTITHHHLRSVFQHGRTGGTVGDHADGEVMRHTGAAQRVR